MEISTKIFALLAASAFTTPIFAQDQTMELVESVGPFQISRVAPSKVCFATYNTLSANDIPSFFATYKLADGDRWHVTGYSEQKDQMKSPDVLTILFDDKQHMISEIEASKGNYFLPFIDDVQLNDFDEKVAISNTVTFSLLRTEDKFTVNLAELRAAKVAIETCLQGLK